MSRRICFIFAWLVMLPLEGYANQDHHEKIVATVNRDIITSSEVQNRKALMSFLGGTQPSSSERQEKEFINLAINNLIEEKILEAEAKKLKIKVLDKEISANIVSIEEDNNLPKGYIEQMLKEGGISYDIFKEYIKNSILQQKLFSIVLNTEYTDMKEELNRLIVNSNKKQKVRFLQFSTEKKHYENIVSFKNRLKTCSISKANDNKKFTVKEVNTEIDKLSTQLRVIVADLNPNDSSEVIKIDGHHMFVCLISKEVSNNSEISQAQGDFLNNILNRKRSAKLYQFINGLKKKSYIKIS